MDSDNNPIPWTDTTLAATAVAPGATAEYVGRGRNGQTIEMSVYFRTTTDIANDDEITVRGTRFAAQVEQWVSPYTQRTGTVVLCTAGEG